MSLKQIWLNLWSCLLPASTAGFSIKNVMASITHISMIILTFKHTDATNLAVILGLWITFVLTLMGIRYAEKKIDGSGGTLPNEGSAQ